MERPAYPSCFGSNKKDVGDRLAEDAALKHAAAGGKGVGKPPREPQTGHGRLGADGVLEYNVDGASLQVPNANTIASCVVI